MKNTFSVSDSFSMGYDLLKKRFGDLMLLVLIIVILDLGFQFGISSFLLLFGSWTTVIASLLSNIVKAYFGLALLLKAIELYDNHDADLSISSFFKAVKLKMFINYILTSILYGLIIVLPMLVLVGIGFLVKLFVFDLFSDPSSPLIILLTVVYAAACLIVLLNLTLRFYLAPYFIADNVTNSASEAITLSSKACKNNVSNLLLFSLAVLGVALIGLILFLIGILFVYPIIIIASVHVYRSLANNSSDAEVIAIEEV
jgi:hypothetical protein